MGDHLGHRRRELDVHLARRAALRRELGREIEVVDENGDRIEYGDYPDEEDVEYD